MAMSHHRLILGALAVSCGLTAAVASPPVLAQARERTLFVSALDKDGKPVEGLGPDAFVVREDGNRREVLRVSRATEPIDVALLVDNSTAAAEDIVFLRNALSAFVARMAPKNQIAVITLADRPTIRVDYTNDAPAPDQGRRRAVSDAHERDDAARRGHRGRAGSGRARNAARGHRAGGDRWPGVHQHLSPGRGQRPAGRQGGAAPGDNRTVLLQRGTRHA